MPFDALFEKYLDGLSAYESGYISGSIYLLEDLLEEVKKYYNEQNKLNKLHFKIVDALSNAYISNRDFKKAVSLMNEYLELDPDNLRILYKFFTLYHDFDINERLALKYYLKVSDISKTDNFESNVDYEVWKLIEFKGKALIQKRKADLMLNLDNDSTKPIDKQNLMKQLPIEVLKKIFDQLDNRSLVNILRVCKGWRNTVLESPLLISSYALKSYITLEQLKSYYRLFDQKVSLSDIVIEKFSLEGLDEVKILKSLIKSTIQVKQLCLSFEDDTNKEFINLVTNPNAILITNLLELKISSDSCQPIIEFVVPLLQNTKNLRKLEIFILYPFYDEEEEVDEDEIDDPKGTIVLDKLEKFTISYTKRNPDGVNISKISKVLVMPNLKQIFVDMSLVEPFLPYFKTPTKLRSLSIARHHINTFFSIVTHPDLSQKFRYLENLEFGDRAFNYTRSIPIGFNPPILPSLKRILFHNTNVNALEIDVLLNSCKSTLEELVIQNDLNNSSNLYNIHYPAMGTRRNDRPNEPLRFDFNYILKSLPKLKKFTLTDRNIPEKFFTKMFMDIALLDRPYHLDYLEIFNQTCTEQVTILMLLSMRDKLFVKHLIIAPKISGTLKPFIELAISSGQIGKIETAKYHQ